MVLLVVNAHCHIAVLYFSVYICIVSVRLDVLDMSTCPGTFRHTDDQDRNPKVNQR